MIVATWNVNGIRARFAEVSTWVDAHRPDVLCLQEIKASPQQVPEPLTGLPAYHNRWHGAAGGYSGVSVHVRRSTSATPQFSVPAFDVETRVLEARVGDWVVASVYVPNGGKDYQAKLEFLRALRAYTARLRGAGERVILCGDLNVALTEADVHPRNRDASTVGQRDEERGLLRAVLDDGGLVDVIRVRHADADDVFTWWPPWRNEKAKNRGWRIDFVAVSAEACDVARCEIHADYGGSDHAPVLVELA